MHDKSAVHNRRSSAQQAITVSQMPESLCRVTVHSEGVSTDLTLPATLPVAELVPSIVDIFGGTAQGRNRLSVVGCAPLPGSTTLAQNGIRDGTVLLLSRQDPQPPAHRCDDDAAAVSAALGPTTPSRKAGRLTGAVAAGGFAAVGAAVLVRNTFVVPPGATVIVAAGVALGALAAAGIGSRAFGDPAAGLALSIVATLFAAVAGLLAVPGPPGAPNVLLAASAAAVTAVLSVRVSHCGATILTVLAGGAAVAAVAALVQMICASPPHVVVSLAVPACLGLIEAAPRMSILIAGLSPVRNEAELTPAALRADGWLTSLRGAFAAAASVSAVAAAWTAHRAIALTVVTGTVLLLHSRTDRRRAMMFAVTGIATIAIGFAIAGIGAPRHGPWIAALTAVLVAAAIHVGFVAPTICLAPATQRLVDALGCVALIAVVPLACWTCGAFSAVRGLSLPT